MACAVLAVAVGLVIPVLTMATPAPASADTVINGCTIVSNPTATNFTNCPGANLAGVDLIGVDLSFANLAGANLAGASFAACSLTGGIPPTSCSGANFANANLSQADLSDSVLTTCISVPRPFPPVACVSAAFTSANLTNANLSGDLLFIDVIIGGSSLGTASPDLTGATLTGANFTGTELVPADQSVTQTSQSGAVVTWPTPSGIPGASPGSCTPASGSNFPLGATTVTCQVLDANNDIATGTFQVTVVPVTQVVLPSAGAVVAGAPYLNATASDAPGVTSVVYEVSGGTLTNQVIATAKPTYYGWIGQWNTTGVPNGAYTLQSVATDSAANSYTSPPVPVTVNNPAPTTSVLFPSAGATVSGASSVLNASASQFVSTVTYELSGGPSNLNDKVIATGTPTYYGWLTQWNTTTVPNGTYTLQSVASYGGGVSGTSAPVSITVNNPPPTTSVLFPSAGASVSGASSVLNASASAYVSAVTYELSGGPSNLNDQVIATGTPTYYGWLAHWNTTGVANGTYTLQSVAAYGGGVSGTSAPITITVNNPPPTTSVLFPSNGANVSGASSVLNASASPYVSAVTYELSGGPSNLNDQVIATGTPTYYGWLTQWNTTTVPNSAYTLQSVASYGGGVSGTSAPITITVNN
jgi:uncharacterized protein YjbI with pentapeptide repeats